MSEYVVEPKSRKELSDLAFAFRKKLGLQDCLYFPIVELLDLMYTLFDGFSYEIVEDSELPPGVHADTDILKKHIRIKQSVYDGATYGNGRDRMTIAHEIGHFFTLCCCGFTFQQNHKKAPVPAFQSPEWQAKCFAGELMVPSHLAYNLKAWEIEEKCGVSYSAASYQYKKMHKKI